MARIFPNVNVGDIPHSSERPVFEALRDQLSSEYTIVHSYPWLRPWRRGALNEGEADFVIIHPDRGILVLEVKGGSSIRYDGRKWYRDTRKGSEEFKDPFSQAQRNMHALLDIIEERSDGKIRKADIVHGYAVVFPHLNYDGALPGHINDKMIISGNGLSRMETAVRDVYAVWTGLSRPITSDKYSVLVDKIIVPKFRFFRPIGVDVRWHSEKLFDLTKVQSRVFSGLYQENRVLVKGVAGSGKTILAYDRALSFARKDAKTLLICYNKELAAWIKQSVEEEPDIESLRNQISVEHFHGLAANLAEKANIDFSPLDGGPPTNAFWDEEVPDLMEQAIFTLEGDNDFGRFDAIVVDEAQDFCLGWWYVLTQSLLKETDGPLYAFMDPNQSIHGDAQLPELNFGSEFELNMNCRNTKRIALGSPSIINLEYEIFQDLPEGLSIQINKVDSVEEEKQVLIKTLKKLLKDDDIEPKDIAVIGSKSKNYGCLFDVGRINRVNMVMSASDWRRGDGILVTTAKSFKGLESNIVVLYGLGDFDNVFSKEDLYVSCTRAVSLLIAVVGVGECRDIMLKVQSVSEEQL